MTTEQKKILTGIKAELEHGDKKEIAKRSNFSEEWVGKCLNPKKDMYNSTIVDAALQLIRERKEKEKEQLQSLQQA